MNSLFGDLGPPPPPGDAKRPLAARMRPRALDEVVGHESILADGQPLRNAIEADVLPSLILWGPPGTGKTTIAELIATKTQALFVRLSAVNAGVADIRKAVDEAKRLRRAGRNTILFIDEIHRFNRGQQDAVLPYVEDGTIALIGATTENPSFEVNAALLSRTRVIVLSSLSDASVASIVERALSDGERGLGTMGLSLEEAARDQLVNLANGDARTALNTLEFAAFAAARHPTAKIITADDLAAALDRRVASYDKAGESHYDTISAFIKSMRGSDPDAALYWLARMIEGGENPLFIARRLVIFASEDVGLADPQALPLAIAAQQAVHFVGMPEGFYALSHATLYLACAPKGNAVGRAYYAAVADVRNTRNEPVPLHLRNAATGFMQTLGYGAGYRYAHSEPEAQAGGERPPTTSAHGFRPPNVAHRRYLEPGVQGREAEIAQWVQRRYEADE